MNAESFFCEENAELGLSAAATRCSVATDQRAWSTFCLQRVFNILPAPLDDHIKVWEGGCGRAEAAERPGDYYTSPHGGGL